MKIKTKVVLSASISGSIAGAITGWYSIPTMLSEWLEIIDYDFIDNYINNELDPYLATIKGILIWSAIGGITMGTFAITSIKIIDCLKSSWENRSQTINQLANSEITSERSPLLSPNNSPIANSVM